MLRARYLFLLALLGLSCEVADDSRPPTCEAVGAHLSEICMSNVFGEGVRLDCQAFGIGSAARRCLMRATQCGPALDDCGVTDIVATCATTTDCPQPLICDPDMQKCTECAPDVPCPTGKSCFGGVCATGP
jgi:hypothetical protein